MKLFIRQEDIRALCNPYKDEGVKFYTDKEIAEEYFKSLGVTFPRKSGKSGYEMQTILEIARLMAGEKQNGRP